MERLACLVVAEIPGVTPSPAEPDGGRGRPRPRGPRTKGRPPRSSGPADAALVLGLLGLAVVWIPVLNWITPVAGVSAVVAGVLGKRAVDAAEGRLVGKAKAVAGASLGVVGILLFLWLALA